MPPKPIHKCEWCSEPLDADGECPNEDCESNNLPVPEQFWQGHVDNMWTDWSDE